MANTTLIWGRSSKQLWNCSCDSGHRPCSACKHKVFLPSWPLARAVFLLVPWGPTLIHRKALEGTLGPAAHRKDFLPVFLEILPHKTQPGMRMPNELVLSVVRLGCQAALLSSGWIEWSPGNGLGRKVGLGVLSCAPWLAYLICFSLACNGIKVWEYLGREHPVICPCESISDT